MASFKQIQLVGFKSFADKTTIPIDQGVTCIVGPNGCGKSNVADAIRWVLGEQSAKMMRGSQMLDVIFNGTESRRKMSFCEVTLTFDNTLRMFDVDADEVEMTRRLYRDGDSEYLLNRQPSRMKVLTSLLHGVGAAKEGYSIIGQGRIELIMNSKPEDRRSIFEEATGIVVFKDRKADAERKLEASKNNLMIFAQRMQEVERQLTPLKKAAENALKYREIYTEMRMHETNLYICRHDGAETEKNKIIVKKLEKTDRSKYLTEHLDELVKEYGLCRDKLNSADSVLQDLNDRMRRYEVSIEHKSGETKLYTERARAVKQKLAAAQEDITYSTKRIDEIDRDIKRIEANTERNNSRITTLNSDCGVLSEEAGELSKKIADYELMTNEHRKKAFDAIKEASEIRQDMGSISAQKELLTERLKEIEAEMRGIIDRHESAKAEYESALERGSKIGSFLEKEDEIISEAQQQVSECADAIRSYANRVYDAEAQIKSLGDTLETYRALRDRFEGYMYSVKRLMNESKTNSELDRRVMGLIADVVSCEGTYEVAIETSFGGAMQNVITATREDARYLIEHLKRTRAGQVTFLPIDAMKPRYENDLIRSAVKERGALGFAIDLVSYDKKFENVIHNLLGNTLIVDNIENATAISRRYPRAFKIVTLDGDLIAVSGSMTGGSKREVAGNLLANERRIKELEEGIEAKRSFLDRASAKTAELQESKRTADANFEQLQSKFAQSRIELASITEKQSSLLMTVTTTESEYAAYTQSVAVLKERLVSLDSKFSDVSQGVSQLSEQSDMASSQITNISAEFEKITLRRNELVEKINSYRLEIASLQSAITASGENIVRLNNEKQSLLDKIEKTNSSIPDIRRQIEELNAQAEKTALTEEEQAVVNDLRKSIAETTESKNSLNERIKEIDFDRLKSYEENEKLAAQIHECDMQLAKIDADLEYLRQRIEEEYGLDYEGCLEFKIDDYEVNGSTAQIANCKRQLTMIGAVNHNAVEEFEELSERFSKMEEEKADLEKAIEDLTIALDEIKGEMLKIFNEGFNTINENFKRTFRELFGGGRAELQLDYTDCDDPLNAGVDIIACPPGKKLTKISLLSGGERALTAIAILFAIIGMRPMPFCVLDEIEAALDEANVARYAKYLKKFAKETQFIVITHRKPTMESADVLFGVTMEEKGVSKIVSVKLSEVETKLGGDSIM